MLPVQVHRYPSTYEGLASSVLVREIVVFAFFGYHALAIRDSVLV
jgi:hypothetical protein